jgi:hypothetical protein
VLETERRRKGECWLYKANRLFRSGAPDCPVVHRTVSDAPGCLDLKTLLSGICRRRTAKIHRTVRCAPDCPVVHRTVSGAPGCLDLKTPLSGICRRRTAKNSPDCPVCTGLSGEPTVGRANGRPRNLRATRGLANGREGAPDCPVCTRLSGAPDPQRSATVDWTV